MQCVAPCCTDSNYSAPFMPCFSSTSPRNVHDRIVCGMNGKIGLLAAAAAGAANKTESALCCTCQNPVEDAARIALLVAD